MKLLSILFCLLTFQTLSICQAVSKSDTCNSYNNHEIQFYIINQVIAAYKYHFTEASAFRLVLNVTGLFNHNDLENVEYHGASVDTLYQSETHEYSSNEQNFELKLQYIHQLKINDGLSLFFGGGPLINYKFYLSDDNYEIIDNDNKKSGRYSKRTQDTWTTGISALAGLKCTVYKNISLFSEYEASINWGWRKNLYTSTSNQVYRETEEYKLFNYELKGLRVGVGVSF